MMIKYLSFDLDGTVLIPRERIADETFEAINSLHERGVITVPTTGRVKTRIPDCIKNIPTIKYAICSNGAKVYDLEKDECIFSSTLEKKQQIEINDIIQKYDLFAEYYIDGKIYCDKKAFVGEYSLPKGKMDEMSRCFIGIEDIYKFVNSNEIEKINLFFVPEDKMKIVCEELTRDNDLKVIAFENRIIAITHISADKGKAAKKLCELLSINENETMAIGDDLNDLGMIEWAEVSVAMGNANDEVRKIAKFSTETCANLGFYSAVNEFVLKKKN